MTDFTTDRATRLEDLRGALLAAAAADLARAEDARAAAPLPRPAARPARRLHLGTLRGRLALALLAVAVAVPGVVIAAGAIGPDQAAANGLPAGSTVMTAAQPTCAAIREGVEYECAFAEPPRVGRVVGTVDASGEVDGGCRAQNAIETFWICYFGEAAVHHRVVAQEVL
jgi:hypothetical protein